MRPHLNARTYIGEMFNFMGHFAELYADRAGIARIRRKNSDLTTPWNPGASSPRSHERERETVAFGEIKKQLVPRYYPSRSSRFFAPSVLSAGFAGFDDGI